MKHIPNILSLFRIIMIPFFVWQMLTGNAFNAAGILCISGFTDLLDGFLARKFGWISPLGKILDPTADKLTQVTVCVVLAGTHNKYWYFFVALLIKDVVMLLLGGYLVKKKIKIEGARWFGKVVTFLFYATMLLIVFFSDLPVWLIVSMLALTTISTFIAGALYIPEYVKYKRGIQKMNLPATGAVMYQDYDTTLRGERD